MTEPTPQSIHDSSAGNVFVGRQRELAELRSALEESLAGRGQMAMLVGEPGIGKTRTAQELTSYAETQGARVLWGRCYEEEGAPPYWPWVGTAGKLPKNWSSACVPSPTTSPASSPKQGPPTARKRQPTRPGKAWCPGNFPLQPCQYPLFPKRHPLSSTTGMGHCSHTPSPAFLNGLSVVPMRLPNPRFFHILKLGTPYDVGPRLPV